MPDRHRITFKVDNEAARRDGYQFICYFSHARPEEHFAFKT